MTQSSQTHTITLGGGCFWCLEAVYLQVRGVLSVESGYSNGQASRPSYEAVCSGQTGCVEVVRLVFEPDQISLDEILEIFFLIHDPTTLNRQGHDVGTQYRSGIYFEGQAQASAAQRFLDEIKAQRAGQPPIVTELLPLANYWPAEAYHQNYYARHPDQGYCVHVVGPKVDKFRRTLKRLMRT